MNRVKLRIVIALILLFVLAVAANAERLICPLEPRGLTEEDLLNCNPIGQWCGNCRVCRPCGNCDTCRPKKKEGAEPVARLTYIYHIVQVRRAGSDTWVDARLNQELEIGDTVQTKRRSKAELIYRGEKLISVGPNTMVDVPNTITKSSDGLWNTIKLFFGFIYVHGSKIDEELKIQTPRYVAGVRGTVFRVGVEEDGSAAIEVLEGSVYVKPRFSSGDERIVGNNRAAMISPSGHIEMVRLSEDQIRERNREFKLLSSRDQKELDKLLGPPEVQQIDDPDRLKHYSTFLKHPDVSEATDLMTSLMQWADSVSQKNGGQITLLALMLNKRQLREYADKFPEALEKCKKVPAEGDSQTCIKEVWTGLLEDYTKSTASLLRAASKFDLRAFRDGSKLMTEANETLTEFCSSVQSEM